ncbi:hypothetical protein [Thiomonas intermedia]|uniref:hypothetical protein n=1 Tax=Thiomonas intermedia TaxID=926 RepID=UPI0009A52888|nr:hypothetical protein [Thiomonas intermedia]
MSKKIKYTDEPIGDVEIIADFLPPPEALVFREEGVKVTLALSKKSVDFFKHQAQAHHSQYQRMIRHLLDAYVDRHSAADPVKTSSSSAAKRGVAKTN